MKKVVLGLFAASSLLLCGFLFGVEGSATTVEKSEKTFMVYYRTWRDQSIPSEQNNQIRMTDIPYGIDVVNVFHANVSDADSKVFFDEVANVYAPELHKRGTKLVRGLDYRELLKVPTTQSQPTAKEFDDYAKQLLDKYMTPGIDGLDFDMESTYTASQLKIAHGVIEALSHYIGPKSDTDTLLIYDTVDIFSLEPFTPVSSAFSFLGAQQYGSNATRAESSWNNKFSKTGIERSQYLVGLSFPEERTNQTWGDTREPYESSNLYSVANYVRTSETGGMFLYAIDRDGIQGRNDQLLKSDFLWTKTAILESKGYSLTESQAFAKHYLARKNDQFSDRQVQELSQQIERATSHYEVNRVFLAAKYEEAVSPEYDPLKEAALMAAEQ